MGQEQSKIDPDNIPWVKPLTEEQLKAAHQSGQDLGENLISIYKENEARVREEAIQEEVKRRLASIQAQKATIKTQTDGHHGETRVSDATEVQRPTSSSSTGSEPLALRSRKQSHATNERPPTINNPTRAQGTSNSVMDIDSPGPLSADGELVEAPGEAQVTAHKPVYSKSSLPKQTRKPTHTAQPTFTREKDNDPAGSNKRFVPEGFQAGTSELPKIQKRGAQTLPQLSTSTSAFSDDRRRSSTFKASAVSTDSSHSTPTSPNNSSGEVPSQLTKRPPKWYNEMRKPTKRDPKDSNASNLVDRLRSQIQKCANQDQGMQDYKKQEDVLRDLLHQAFFVKVNEVVVRQGLMLTINTGLSVLFVAECAKGKIWPFDIKSDAEELYNKWSRKDFDTDLLRGIRPGQPKIGTKTERSSDSIDPAYKNDGRVINSKFYGNGLLLNGQWWPTQLTALRDGAHGASQGGISGGDEGVYSCIVSGGHSYPDKDEAAVVLYCGTDSSNGEITEHTRQMITNETSKKPVRLIRSHNGTSKWAPKMGFRYDGLYSVDSHERLDPVDSTRQRHRFKLIRLPGQDPIRGGDDAATRPNIREIEAFEKDKRLRGFT